MARLPLKIVPFREVQGLAIVVIQLCELEIDIVVNVPHPAITYRKIKQDLLVVIVSGEFGVDPFKRLMVD